jgi:hypothetical protein
VHLAPTSSFPGVFRDGVLASGRDAPLPVVSAGAENEVAHDILRGINSVTTHPTFENEL